MYGYFSGDIKGIDKRHHIRETKFIRDGVLELDPRGAPF